VGPSRFGCDLPLCSIQKANGELNLLNNKIQGTTYGDRKPDASDNALQHSSGMLSSRNARTETSKRLPGNETKNTKNSKHDTFFTSPFADPDSAPVRFSMIE